MKAQSCEFEEKVVQAAVAGTAEVQDITAHLAGCESCRQVAAIVQGVTSRLAGMEPGSGLLDDAERLWHVARHYQLPHARSSAGWNLVLVRLVALAAPPLIAVLVLRRYMSPSGLLNEISRLFHTIPGTGLAYLSMDPAIVIAGLLFLVTAFADLRAALTD